MSDAPTSTLDRLLAECISALEEHDQETVERLIDANPEHAAVLRERLEQLNSLGILAAPPAAPKIPERLGDFRLLRQIGRGGMGIVYLAEQDSLQRQVALKLVHPEQLLFGGARERFRREVLAIARLQHNGIVPILTGGEADGIPFYAMELVNGASLSELLTELEGTAPAALEGATLRAALLRAMSTKHDMAEVVDTDLYNGSWTKVCCRLATMACEALQHAHQHGVLHRDLKPSNLLLTTDGQVRLIDFGLASASGEQRITRSGATLGSLPYMAPEQLRGAMDQLDERTDIYQLGVTFYELLALRLPHGDGTGNTRERILAGMPAPPSRHTPQVHPDVDAICMQAMDLNPSRRYQTAQELQQDLEAFLEQRTVQARRPSTALRAMRWVRRHPMTAGCAIAATALFVIAPLGIAIQQNLSNQRIQAALKTANEQRAIAEQNFGEALNAIHQMLLRTAEARLAEVPRTAPLRRQLVEDAVAIHSRLVTSDPQSSDKIHRIQARTHGQLGELHLELGALGDAETSLRTAIQSFEALLGAKDSGHRDTYRFRLAELQLSMAALHAARAEHPAALDAYRRATEYYDEIPATAGLTNLRKHRMTARLAYSRALARSGHTDAASKHWRELDEALATPAAVEAHRMASTTRVALWAQVAQSRGILAAQSGDPGTAQREFAEAMRRVDTEGDVIEDDTLLQLGATISEQLGLLLHQQRNWEQATSWLDRAYGFFKASVDRDPDIPRNHIRLARLLTVRAENRMRRGIPNDAGKDFDRAIELLTNTIAAAPDNMSARQALAMAHAERATFQLALDDTIAAILSFEEAERQFEALLEKVPGSRMLRGNFAALLANAALAIAAEGDAETGANKLVRAIEIQDAMQGTEPERQSIEMRVHASRLARQAGNFDAAERVMTEAQSRCKNYLAAGPDEPIRVQTASFVGIEAGELQFLLDRTRAATGIWSTTVPTARLAGDHSRFGKRLLQRLLLRLADAHLRLAEPEAARTWFQDAVANGASKDVVGNARRLKELFDRPELRNAPNDK